jgi:hypothetical protein
MAMGGMEVGRSEKGVEMREREEREKRRSYVQELYEAPN